MASTSTDPPPPLVPLEYCDAPNQRFYVISLLALQQSYKLFQFLEAYVTSSAVPSTSTAASAAALLSTSSRTSLLWKWALYDAVTLGFLLPGLRIPRLQWSRQGRVLAILALLLLNWVLAGDWRAMNILGLLGVVLPTSFRDYFNFDMAILEHRIRWNKLVDPASHILGSHTIHILPHSTAKLLIADASTRSGAIQCYCVSTEDSLLYGIGGAQSRVATLPLILNNTQPKYLQYSIQGFGEDYASRALYNLTGRDLRKIASHKSQKSRRNDYDYDEEAEEEEEYDFASESGTLAQRLIGYDSASDSDNTLGLTPHGSSSAGTGELAHNQARENALIRNVDLQKTQSIYAFSVSRPGTVRIERVIDKSDNDVRIPHQLSESAKLLIVPCPSASFASTDSVQSATSGNKKHTRSSASSVQTACVGDDVSALVTGRQQDASLFSVDVFGYPPLKLTYHRLLGASGKRESYTIDGIAPEGAILASHSASDKSKKGGNQKAGLANGAPAGGHQQQILAASAGPAGADTASTHSASNAMSPQTINVPLNVSLSLPGTHLYRLDKVTDACGNILDFSSLRERYLSDSATQQKEATARKSGVTSKLGAVVTGGNRKQGVATLLEEASSRKLMVYPRSQVQFVGCGTGSLGSSAGSSATGGGGQPIKLLKGKKANLQFNVKTDTPPMDPRQNQNAVLDDAPWNVKVKFEPEQESLEDVGEEAGKAVVKSGETAGWERELKLSRKTEMLEVDRPGKYSITGLDGAHCTGEVLEPSECVVYTPSLPTVDLSLDPITDSCAGEVGLRAILSLSGEPPYRLSYSVKHGNSRPVKKTKQIRLSREEIELKPDQTGEFTYRFESVDDKNYQGIKIGREVKQTVHPLAGVRFEQAGKEQMVWSCEGDSIQVPIELKGIAPWKVDYKIVGQKDVHTVQSISETKHSLDVKIPSKIAKTGGSFTLSIVQVIDGRGCSQPMTVEDLVVKVRRTKPTAAFAQSKKVIVKQGDVIQLPLRLTGEGPWKVAYTHPSATSPKTIKIQANNAYLSISEAGHYELISVSDAHCPGTVNDASKTFDIEWIAKPSVHLAEGAGKLVKNGSLIRAPVCEGVEDTAGVVFAGKSPYLVTYDLVEDGAEGQKSRTSRELQSVQKQAQFELSTTTAGHRIYDFTGMSDATYTTLSRDTLDAPADSAKQHLVRLEQSTLARPTAVFVEQDRKAVYCVKDSLQTSQAHSPSLRLSGQAPFRVEFEIAPEGSHMSQRYSDVFIKSTQWKLELPHTFSEPGPYSIFIRKIVDNTGCERIISRGTKGTFTRIEVAEIASIAAVQPQDDHCVGDSIDFVLQGAAPWTVQYEFEGKKQKVTNRDSRFSRVAEQPGGFKVLSVAHRQDSCKSIITDISKTIHPLPVARIHSGNTYSENIREGDQAEIIFEFDGTPPFTFTYTKSAPAGSSGKSKRPSAQVLETHTITGVETNRYTIYTQSEGTWNVVAVQDKYCAYPPLARSDRKAIKNS